MHPAIEEKYEIIPVKLDDGEEILIETRMLGGEQPVSNIIPDFEDVSGQIQKVLSKISDSLTSPSIDTVEVEFSIELAMKSGKLSALVVEGSGKANMKIKCVMKRS